MRQSKTHFEAEHPLGSKCTRQLKEEMFSSFKSSVAFFIILRQHHLHIDRLFFKMVCDLKLVDM